MYVCMRSLQKMLQRPFPTFESLVDDTFQHADVSYPIAPLPETLVLSPLSGKKHGRMDKHA